MIDFLNIFISIEFELSVNSDHLDQLYHKNRVALSIFVTGLRHKCR